VENLNQLLGHIYKNKKLKTHWLVNSCCYDSVEMWSAGNISELPFSTTMHDCDLLVVAAKLGYDDFMAVKKRMQQEHPPVVVALGNCAISGGMFTYNQYSINDLNSDKVFNISGCPPTFEYFAHNLLDFLGIKR
jgi:NADH:ubiquinone oxidoreductase subunit B-like Fe-S oxidoreductase